MWCLARGPAGWLFRSDSTWSGHGTALSVGVVGRDTLANVSDFILSREINCGTWELRNAPRSHPRSSHPCAAVNNNWEKSAQPAASVYNLRIITKIEWLFVKINLHKTFLSDKVILWPWKRTRPRSLSQTQKAYFTYKHRVFTHTGSVLYDVLYNRRDSLVALFDFNCTPQRPKSQIFWVWLHVWQGMSRLTCHVKCDAVRDRDSLWSSIIIFLLCCFHCWVKILLGWHNADSL